MYEDSEPVSEDDGWVMVTVVPEGVFDGFDVLSVLPEDQLEEVILTKDDEVA